MKKIVFVMAIIYEVLCFSYDNKKEIFSDMFIHKYDSYSSSYLIDQKYPKDKYSIDKAFDGKDETAWVAGGNNNGINEYIYFPIVVGIVDNSFPKLTYLEIKNGFFKNTALYYANNRLKRVDLEIYECDVVIRGMKRVMVQEPLLNSIISINFEDKMVVKKIEIIINNKLKSKQEFPGFLYIGKLTIKEIYKGNVYNDTCISEINSYPRPDIFD